MKKVSRILSIIIALVLITALPALAAETNDAPEVTGDHVVLKAICFAGEGQLMCDQLLKACQYVEEHSNDTVEFEYYLGGTYCNMIEEFGNVSEGSVDMCALMDGAGQATAMLSLFQYARTADTNQFSVEVCNKIMNEDPETSPLLIGQMNEMNIMPLGYCISGTDAYCAVSPIESFADMANLTFGCSRNQAFFEGLGLNVISVEMQDIYESLSRGLIQATSSALNNLAGQKLYEVAPNVLVSDCGGAAGIICMNLDKWNSLSESQQQCFRDGYEFARQWAAEEYDNMVEAAIASMEAGGATVKYLSEEDNAFLKNVSTQSQWNSCFATADAQGLAEEFTLVFDKAAAEVGGTYTK